MTDATAVRRRVRLLNLPIELLFRNRRHLDDLLHELHIMQAGAVSGQVEPGPRLAALMSDLLDAYSPVRDVVWEQAERARAMGRRTVDVDLEVPVAVAGDAARMVELLERADRMCQDLELLTLAAPPDVADLRRWISAQIVGQVDRGEEPEPYRR